MSLSRTKFGSRLGVAAAALAATVFGAYVVAGGGGNASPVTDAGPDQGITLPDTDAVLDCDATDSDGTITGYAWTNVSGPATPTFNPNNTTAGATAEGMTVAGAYVLRCTATDDGSATDADDVTITVTDPAPSINAGPDADATEDVAYNLQGSCSDNASATCTWSQTVGSGCGFTNLGAGAGIVACADVEDDTIDATCSAVESATVQLSCNDGVNSAVTDTLALNVETGAVPLPNDASIYSTMGTNEAFWIGRAAYTSCDGDATCGDCTDTGLVNQWCNGNAPGTYDLVFSGALRPVFRATGGPDSRGCVDFVSSDYGSATGFTVSQSGGTNEPFIQVVADLDAVSVISAGVHLYGAGSHFTSLVQHRNCGSPPCLLWRFNGNPATTSPDNLDITSPAPNTSPHLHEIHWIAEGFRAYLDGTIFATVGGTGGLEGDDYATFRVGASSAGLEPIDGCISEIVMTERNGDSTAVAQAEAYRDLRICAEYPSITLDECTP